MSPGTVGSFLHSPQAAGSRTLGQFKQQALGRSCCSAGPDALSVARAWPALAAAQSASRGRAPLSLQTL